MKFPKIVLPVWFGQMFCKHDYKVTYLHLILCGKKRLLIYKCSVCGKKKCEFL